MENVRSSNYLSLRNMGGKAKYRCHLSMLKVNSLRYIYHKYNENREPWLHEVMCKKITKPHKSFFHNKFKYEKI